MNVCVIIPVYNHQQAIVIVVKELKRLGVRCILVNDGSSVVCSEILERIANEENDWLTLFQRTNNGGKGAAVVDGFRIAIEKGFSHAIQIDADGQHKIHDIRLFLDTCQQHPDKLLLGYPQFDGSIPKKRLYGRLLTNVWIWINTLSFSIADGMCGFRCYPLAAVQTLLKTVNLGERMDFDIDIAVRLYWQGLDMINIPTKVSYPIDGVSHFKMLRDNFFISKKHAQLFFCMLPRLPKLILRQLR